jgi:hypothetical protein
MFGTFTFSYTPPEDCSRECNVTLSFSSENEMGDVISHFENFLRAIGYPLNFSDKLEVVSDPEIPGSTLESWEDYFAGRGFNFDQYRAEDNN